jgi:hypothetical protein
VCLLFTLSTTATARTQDSLAEVRGATAQFHRIEVAEEMHYHLGIPSMSPPLDHCIAHPTDGAMGYHYFNQDLLFNDIETLDPLRPEALVYAPGPNGTRQLAAVEYIIPSGPWHAAGNTEPPVILGVPMHILNPALGWYILHAWVWQFNPAGMFEDWNPVVVCPEP